MLTVDDVSIFGEYVVRQLRDIPEKKERLFLQHEIQNLIFNHQMGYHNMRDYSPVMQQQRYTSYSPTIQYSPFKTNTNVQQDDIFTAGNASTPQSGTVHVSPESKKTYIGLESATVMNTRSRKKKGEHCELFGQIKGKCF